ncbi:CRISPR-associated protein Cse1 [Pararhodospirillum oryzae]|uniref:CRISPR-associated protein Cse1 n=1 Tax=Pararhodospirillum oryzae TaxID=478448 RepID=A0A512H967_9PROT|nr:CRISPR-associated protein Cse1 [Pararhodospirillum oryzae]GEO82006.1 CRISPR-associated protein Cse1 [Pararhodospirillum oryzae]
MTQALFNLLSAPLIRVAPGGRLTLPGVLAALARDDIETFPALRPHQGPAWHMFLVQLAGLALHRAGETTLPAREEAWTSLLRGLTDAFSDDEPWCLVVEDDGKPAFLQPPVPAGMTLAKSVHTPDALDLLITARNHDIKQAIARHGEPDDWLFALVSLQTGEGFSGRDNYGIARMNGGSSSRPMLALAPCPPHAPKTASPRPGAWFCHNVKALLDNRERELDRHAPLDTPDSGGLGLVWLAPWPDGQSLELRALDLWFIEVCRRVRLEIVEGRIIARKGTSKTTRINAKHLSGAVGDPFAPVSRTEGKSFTLSERDFDYRTLCELLLSGDWEVPVLARPGPSDQGTYLLVAAALARGNSKTYGFKSRVLPLAGPIARALGPRRQELHELAKAQIKGIGEIDKVLAFALALAAAGGDKDKVSKEHYAHARARAARDRFDQGADEIFFDHLWARFAAQDQGPDAVKAEEDRFARALIDIAGAVFEAALPALPGHGLFRPRARARARAAFWGRARHAYPDLFPRPPQEETVHDVQQDEAGRELA